MPDVGEGQTLTDDPRGVVKAVPSKEHLALGAVALALSGFSPAVSDPTGCGDDDGDLAAVRRGDAEDPCRNRYDGMAGVRAAAAAG